MITSLYNVAIGRASNPLGDNLRSYLVRYHLTLYALPAAIAAAGVTRRRISRSAEASDMNHDERHDVWYDAGHGNFLLLVVLVFALAAAALVKYLRSRSGGG